MRKIFGHGDRAELVAAVKRGEAVASVANRIGVTPATAYAWLRKAREGSRESAVQPTFLELVTSGSTGLMVRIGFAEIEVRPGFDADLLRAIVAVLGGTP